MNIISLLVHEKKDVIIDQIKNFRRFSNCHFVIHISLSASFSKEDLLKEIKNHDLLDVTHINPISVPTKWGSIIDAHVANLNYISNNIREAKNIIFHSSNDMLVKQGLNESLKQKSFFFHTRYFDFKGNWWPGSKALTDFEFNKSLTNISGVARIIASQVEGSVYHIDFIKEFLNLWNTGNIKTNIKINYPREEIFFSSIAYALGVRPVADPYIFSEVQRFDMHDFNIRRKLDNLFIPSTYRINKFLSDILIKSHLAEISYRDIKNIRKNKIPKIKLFDSPDYWIPYNNPSEIYGVKRIERKINDTLRKKIRKLDS